MLRAQVKGAGPAGKVAAVVYLEAGQQRDPAAQDSSLPENRGISRGRKGGVFIRG